MSFFRASSPLSHALRLSWLNACRCPQAVDRHLRAIPLRAPHPHLRPPLMAAGATHNHSLVARPARVVRSGGYTDHRIPSWKWRKKGRAGRGKGLWGNREKAGVGDKRGVFGVMRAPLGLFCTNWHSR